MLILSKIANDALAAKQNNSQHNVEVLIKDCVNAVTLLGHSTAELAQKRRNNIWSLVQSEPQSLCGPRLATSDSKNEPKNQGTGFLIGDDLVSEAKKAKNVAQITVSARTANTSSLKKPGQSSTITNRSSQQTSGFRHGPHPTNKYKTYSANSSTNYNTTTNTVLCACKTTSGWQDFRTA